MINMHKVDLSSSWTFGLKCYFIQAGRKKFLKQPVLLIKTFGDTFFADYITSLQKLVSEKGFFKGRKNKDF